MKFVFLVFLSGFLLFIQAKDYKGAEYRTKLAYTYGRFEVNYKATQRDGVLASFFTYYDGGGGTSAWNEIDIEIMGRYTDDVQFNTITPGQLNHVRHQAVKFNPCTSFNTYAFEWTPDYVAWFINDEEVYRQTGSHIQTLTRAQKIMMNTWIPQFINWAGVFNPEALPAFSYYDWVSYYSYTPGTGSYGTDNNFSHQWTDNFDTFDSNRWAKASHTWNENLCDFIPENVVFKDGKMILCLTDAVNTGMKDVKKPVLLYARSEPGKITATFSEELDSVTSQQVSNYMLSGYSVESVRLLPGEKSVELSVPGLNLSQPANMLVLNVKDTSGNVMAVKNVSLYLTQNFQFPLRINPGSNYMYRDFLPDREFTPDADYGYMDGSSTFYGGSSIAETEDDSVYIAERKGLVKYCVRLPAGIYELELWFAENFFSASGARIFDVYVEGNQVINNLDIFAAAGQRTSHKFTFNITVDDGVLDIHFPAEIYEALINGIVISQLPSSVRDHGSLDEFQLYQNYPNPFNTGTKITYNTGGEEYVTLEIFNLLGEIVFSESIPAGQHSAGEFKLDAAFLASGIYLYKLRGKSNMAVKKMILMK